MVSLAFTQKHSYSQQLFFPWVVESEFISNGTVILGLAGWWGQEEVVCAVVSFPSWETFNLKGWTCVEICPKIIMLNHSEDIKGKAPRDAEIFNNAKTFQVNWSILINWNWRLAASSLTRINGSCLMAQMKNVKPNIVLLLRCWKAIFTSAYTYIYTC